MSVPPQETPADARPHPREAPLAVSEESFRRAGHELEGSVRKALGRAAESDGALTELIEGYERQAAYNIAHLLAFRGEVDRAFTWLDKAVAYDDPGLAEIFVLPEFEVELPGERARPAL